MDIRAEFMSSELCCVNVSEIESVHVKRNSFAIQHVKSDMYSLYTKLEPFKTEILDFVGTFNLICLFFFFVNAVTYLVDVCVKMLHCHLIDCHLRQICDVQPPCWFQVHMVPENQVF